MFIIKVNGSIEKALKALKAKVNKTGMNQELRERESFTKPSVKRRNQVKDAIYREKKGY